MTYSYQSGFSGTPSPVAGKYGSMLSGFNKEEAQSYKDALGEWGPLLYFMDKKQQRSEDPELLRQQIAPIEEMLGRIGEKQQKFGLQSNLIGAGINAFSQIPQTMNAFRAIPLQALAGQIDSVQGALGRYAPTAYTGLNYRLAGGRS
jgi:hypothetical protein